MAVINNVVMNSKYIKIGLYIILCLNVIDVCVAQSSLGHFWSGKCSSRGHHSCHFLLFSMNFLDIGGHAFYCKEF